MSIVLLDRPKTAIRRFFDRRAKNSDTHTFGLKNTYVFASKEGVLFLVLLVITFIAGVNYGNNLVLALFFYLVSVWLISAYVAFTQIASLTVSLKHIELGQAGDVAWATLGVSTKAKFVRQVSLGFAKNPSVQDTLTAPKLAQYENHSTLWLSEVTGTPSLVKLPIFLEKRGENPLPMLTLSCKFPLGIVVAWSYAKFATPALAYPKPLPFDINTLKSVIANQDQENALAHQAGLSDFDRLDNYVLGENLARVSWGHLARGAGLLTKHFSDAVGQDQVLDYHQMPTMHHEDKLSMLSYAVQSFAHSPHPFLLKLPSSSGEFGTGEVFLEHCLLRLAKEP